MEAKSCFMEGWERFFAVYKESIEDELEFNYGKMEQPKNNIVEALTFWFFVQSVIGEVDTNEDAAKKWQERKEILSTFIGHKNYLVSLVATLESLPTSVWREILWQANISFVSFESFLRRVEGKQIEAINRNYRELFEKNRVPSVFGRFKRWCKGITVESLFRENFNKSLRYQSKGSMSYNLLGLDFGFNAYPKGVTDDIKIVEISPMRFLSTKEHADDFVVNTEFGKYWWLYRKARSNYVWFPSDKVELNTHICPGFWYTLFVHAIFWVISPLVTVWTASMALQHFTYWLIIPAILGALTPLWMLAALAKLVALGVFKPFAKFIDRWKEKNPKHAKFLGEYTFYAFCILIVTIVTYHLFEIAQISLGIYGAGWCIFLFYMFIGYYFWHSAEDEYDRYPKIREFPGYFKFPMIVTGAIVIANFYLEYPEVIKAIVVVTLIILETMWDFVVVISGAIVKAVIWLFDEILTLLWVFGWPGIIFIGASALLMFFQLFFFARLEKMPEEKQSRICEIIDRLATRSLVALPIVVALLLLYLVAQSGFDRNLVAPIVWSFFLITVIVALSIFMSKRALEANPVLANYKSRLRWYIEADDCLFSWHQWEKISLKNISKNPWLTSLKDGDLKDCVYKIGKLIKSIYFRHEDAEVISIFNLILLKVNKTSLQELEEHSDELFRVPRRLRQDVIRRVLSGKSFEKAAKEAGEHQEKFDKAIKRVTLILKIVFFPIFLLWKLIALIGRTIKKTVEIAVTLRRIAKWFNEKCPFVFKPQTLKF